MRPCLVASSKMFPKRKGTMRKIVQRVAAWWHGKYIAPARDSVVMSDLTAPYERHWTSHFAHVVWNFHVKHWKIVIGGAVALILAINQD